MRSLPFQLPENFLLIVRAMSLTSGMCSSLDPAFNIWDAVEPYAARLLRDERGNIVQDLAQRALSTAGLVARMPQRVDDVLTRLEDGRIAVDTPRLEKRVAALERTARRAVSAIVFAGLLVGGALLRPVDDVWGIVLMIASVPPLLHALFAGIVARRTGRHGAGS